MSRRTYKSGSRWAMWRWKDILFSGSLYLSRLHLIHTPLGGVMLHWIPNPDPQRDLHDHPAAFLSVVLRGGYIEATPHPPERMIRWLNWKRAQDSHRIVWTHRKTITLVVYGPSRRVWGFYTQNGWVPWREYEDRGEQV